MKRVDHVYTIWYISHGIHLDRRRGTRMLILLVILTFGALGGLGYAVVNNNKILGYFMCILGGIFLSAVGFELVMKLVQVAANAMAIG